MSELDEQKKIDADRAAMADSIVAGQNITTVEAGKRFARGWIITAAQHAANEEYYREQRDRLAKWTRELLAVLERANGQLFDSSVDDVEHQIDGHADALSQTLRRVAAGHAAALETLQVVVHELVEGCELLTEKLLKAT